MTNAPTLTPAQLDEFGAEMDAIRQSVVDDLGTRDTDYIARMIRLQRALEVAGRGMFFVSFLPPAWIGGVAALSLSKILDNMEIGHNVMHGQYDWTNDPALNSKRFEWDTSAPGNHWRRSHNYEHHTHTNILGKDRDVGYGLLRMSEQQEWRPAHLANPVMAVWLATFFQYGVMLHELEIERLLSGERPWSDTKQIRREMAAKVGRQTLKDYVLFPALTGPSFLFTLAGNATANLVRNVWAFTIIFCGHFPDGAEVFTEEEAANESRGGWYYRQLLGSANITGGKIFHVLSGNLSHQIEHHLFPDLPAHRYAEIAPRVQAVCEKFGLPYNSGGLAKQFGSVVRKIARLALPGQGSDATVSDLQARPAGAQPAGVAA
ncbi:MAG: acyl-CoA desaturase [Acidimicrobiales bacterium]